MSEERAVVGGNALTEEEIAKYTDDELADYFAEIAERGVIDIRTNVQLPPELKGQWFRNTPEDIAAARANGYEVDTKYAAQSAVHSDGHGNPVIGDVVFMTCSTRVYNAHKVAADRRFRQVHGVARGTQEEKDFESQIKSAGLGEKYRGAKINTSIQERVNANQISNAIKLEN